MPNRTGSTKTESEFTLFLPFEGKLSLHPSLNNDLLGQFFSTVISVTSGTVRPELHNKSLNSSFTGHHTMSTYVLLGDNCRIDLGCAHAIVPFYRRILRDITFLTGLLWQGHGTLKDCHNTNAKHDRCHRATLALQNFTWNEGSCFNPCIYPKKTMEGNSPHPLEYASFIQYGGP